MQADTQQRMQIGEWELAGWDRDGYVVVRGLWSAEEVAACRRVFDGMIERGEAVPGHWDPNPASDQPVKRYPRVMHPHRFDATSRAILLDSRIERVLAALMGEEPIATQSMFYFKPPGGKGQALHQDNYYLRVRPKTCVAAWTAIDPAFPDNGGLYVCPGTHTMEVKCPTLANPDESFTTDFVAPPAGITPVPVVLEPGDVLFFNGSVVHGSRPNKTKDTWRRSFICHYAPASATHMSQHYRPMLRFDGSRFEFEIEQGGGPCGKEFVVSGDEPTDWKKALDAGMVPMSTGSIPG